MTLLQSVVGVETTHADQTNFYCFLSCFTLLALFSFLSFLCLFLSHFAPFVVFLRTLVVPAFTPLPSSKQRGEVGVIPRYRQLLFLDALLRRQEVDWRSSLILGIVLGDVCFLLACRVSLALSFISIPSRVNRRNLRRGTLLKLEFTYACIASMLVGHAIAVSRTYHNSCVRPSRPKRHQIGIFQWVRAYSDN